MDLSLQRIFANTVKNAFLELYNQEIPSEVISFQETRKEFVGDFTLVIFPLLKFSRRTVEHTAKDLGAYLVHHVQEVQFYNAIKGFLNFSMSDNYWISCLKESFFKNGRKLSPVGETVMVEFSSPNTNKPLHLGHIRNNLLGFSVSAMLEACGYEVIKTCLVNDRGIHICKSMLAWLRWGNGETPFGSGIKGDHLVGKYYVLFDKAYKVQIREMVDNGSDEETAERSAPLIREAREMLVRWEAGDPETIRVWKMMNEWVYEGFRETYERLNISFDHIYYESDTYGLGKDMIEEGLEKGVFYKKLDGSVWIDLTAEGLDEKLVLRGDGTSVYITQDLGTAQLKYDGYHAEKSIHVVGNEQDYHFKVLFLIIKKLGKPWAKGLMHLSYGMVDLPSGKMKSREGTVVDADDLMSMMVETAREKTESLGKVTSLSFKEKEGLYQKIGMGALKYFLLKVDPVKRFLFNPEESIDFQGHTGPFIQYSYARIQSMMNKEDAPPAEIFYSRELNEEERAVIKWIYAYQENLELGASQLRPDIMASYLYELAKNFNKFYHMHPVLKAEDRETKEFRLNLSKICGQTIKTGMALLGIGVPEQM